MPRFSKTGAAGSPITINAPVLTLLILACMIFQGPAVSLEARTPSHDNETRVCGTCVYMDEQMDRIKKGLDPDYGPGVVPRGFFDSYIEAAMAARESGDGIVTATGVSATSGTVTTLDSPWLWPTLLNGGQTMNTVATNRTDTDGDGLRECRYTYDLSGLKTGVGAYGDAEVLALEAETDKAFAHWNEALAYVGLEFKRVTDGTQHIVVGSTSYGSGTTGQASLFGAFFNFSSSSYLNYNYNYVNYGSHYHFVEEGDTLIDRPPGNPYVSLLKRYGQMDSVKVGGNERYSTIYNTAIHEIGHLMGLNHTFNSLAAAAVNHSDNYSVDWLANDINVAYSAMPKVTAIDGEDMVDGLWFRGLNNSFMTYDEPGNALWLGLTPQIKGYVALIYRDNKGDSRVKAAELLALAKSERDKYTSFRHSNIVHEAENNNTAGTAQSIIVGQSVLGAISSWDTTTYTDGSDQADTNDGSDVDWYALNLTSGTTYYFDIDLGSTGMSTALYLFTPSDQASAIAFSAPEGNDWFNYQTSGVDTGSVMDVKFDGGVSYYGLPDPFITYTAATTGTHYVKVTWNTSLTWVKKGDYFLRTSTAKVTTAPTLAVDSSGSDLQFSWNGVVGASEYWLRENVQGSTAYTYCKNIAANLNDPTGKVSHSLTKPATGTYEYAVMAINNQNENDNSYTWSNVVSNVTGTCNLTVDITGPTSGAQWQLSIVDSTWRNSGTSVSLPENTSYTVTFKDVRGWTKPNAIIGTLTADTSQTGAYTSKTGYSMTVTVADDSTTEDITGAKWYIVKPTEAGTGERNSGDSVTLYEGEAYEVAFTTVSGWNVPSPKIEGFMAAQNLSLTGTYTRIYHTLTVTIFPSGAVTDGAKWYLNGNGPYDSTTFQSVGEGASYSVTFKDLTTAPWNRPSNQTGTMSTTDVSLTGTYTANQLPIVTFTAPGSFGATVNASYMVTWSDGDDDDGTTLAIFLDTDTSWSGPADSLVGVDGTETLLKSGILLATDGDADLADRLDLSSVTSGTPANGSHPLSSVANGTYYFLAVADDNRNSAVRTWSAGKLTVNHAGSIGGIRVSNLTDSSAVITWTTDVAGIGQIGYGTTTALGPATADARGLNLKVHRVEITGLTAATAYRYDLKVTLETAYQGLAEFHDNAIGATYTFTTAASAAKGNSHTVTGKAIKKDDYTPIQSAVVAVKAVESTYVSALTDASGDFIVDLADLKDPADGSVFVYSAGDSLVIEGFGGDAGTFSGSADLTQTDIDLGTTTVDSLEFVTEITQSYDLAKGFNLLSVPLTLNAAADTSTFSAYDLFDEVSSLVAVYRYAPDTGYQAAFYDGSRTGTDFDIEPGRGYWLKITNTEGETLDLTGKIISTPQAMNLAGGFNLIGFTSASGYPNQTAVSSYTPGSLLTSIKDGETVTALAIYAWVDGGYSLCYYNSNDGSTTLVGFFGVELTRGYFIKMSKTTAFTPSN